MSSDFYKRTLLTLYMEHEIELDVSLNLIYIFPMIYVTGFAKTRHLRTQWQRTFFIFNR